MKDKHKQILINTLKIALATISAILLASCLHLENIYSAGIVAILSIQPTKKETLSTALSRCLAFILALIIAWFSFQTIGYNEKGFYLYILLFILVCQYFRWYSAMAMDSVIILHFISFGNMALPALFNEIGIFTIGIAMGIAANLHLHKDRRAITLQTEDIDSQIRNIIRRMADRLLVSDKSDYNGECFRKLSTSLNTAENTARRNFANQFGKRDDFDIRYLLMRRRQEFVLMEMYRNLRLINTTPQTVNPVAAFLRQVSDNYYPENDAAGLISQLEELKMMMKQTPLPENREEFENRARLYVLLQQLHNFLTIKYEFRKAT